MRTDRIAGENSEGYSNLCRLVTLQQMGTVAPSPKTEDAENEGRPVTLEELARHSKGVIALASLLRRNKTPAGKDGKELHRCRECRANQKISKEFWANRFILPCNVFRRATADGSAKRNASVAI